jgi:divalent metal cation (Fe/Co/Zn/Cd) transporter
MMNLLLSAAKLIIGLKINSRAVMLDAVNGFSDMATSVLSILSTLFGGKRVDRAHPFGYGRLEYITSMFGNVFVIFMAARAIYDSIRDLINADAAAPIYTQRSSSLWLYPWWQRWCMAFLRDSRVKESGLPPWS